jgi:ribose transport system permease protein
VSEEPTARLSQPEPASPPPPPETGLTTVPPPPQVPPPPPFAPAPPVRPVRSAPSLLPHLIWEAVLLLTTAAVVVLAAVNTEGLFEDPTWWSIAYFGLLASGLALSLRAGGPNLAVAAVAVFSGAVYAELTTGEFDYPPLLAAAVALGAALLAGVLLGLVAGLTSVPAWAVSLGGLVLLLAAVFGMLDPVEVAVVEPIPEPLDQPAIWVVLFLVVSLAGGALAAIPAMRRWFAARRDASPQFSGARLVGSLVGFSGSSLLAGLAGLVLVSETRAVFPSIDMLSLLLALAVVLLGGVSAFGGRGGIAGTALAVALVVAVRHWLLVEDASVAVLWAAVGAMLIIGVLATRLIEAIAPLPREELPSGQLSHL